MASTGVRAPGLGKLRKALKSAGDDLADFKATNKEVATFVADRARPGMPHKSGALASSTRTAGGATRAIVKVGSSRVPYAGPILWGWRARNIRPAKVTPYAVALETMPTWIDLYWDRVTKILQRVSGD